MTAEAAKTEILASKAVCAEKMIRVLEFHTAEQKKIKLAKQAKQTLSLTHIRRCRLKERFHSPRASYYV